MYAEVILPVPVGRSFTYAIPAVCADIIKVGCKVSVPFGRNKLHTGIVLSLHENPCSNAFEIKEIRELLGSEPVVGEKDLRLWEWIADYYMCALGDVMKAALPSAVKQTGNVKVKKELHVKLADRLFDKTALNETFESLQKTPRRYALLRKLVEMTSFDTAIKLNNRNLIRQVSRAQLLHESNTSAAVLLGLKAKGIIEIYEYEVLPQQNSTGSIVDMLPLSDSQQKALDEIVNIHSHKSVCLLHGVTSSGKTEIYIRLIRQMAAQGKQVLYLLPEIALTTQITQRLRRVFGDEMGVYHSRCTDAERLEIWQKQRSDKPFQLIVGVRSSIFLPQKNLGLVIVDEEHETSYKQQEPAPRYNARDTAIMLAHIHNARVLLGSATPSIETYHNTTLGKYGYVKLDQRYGGIMLPQIDVVDVQDLVRRKIMNQPFSPMLEQEMQQALEHGEQVILFQNRRGYAPVVECVQCGWIPTCEYCDVSLTYHHEDQKLHCHYCGNSFPIPAKCPNCGGHDLRSYGFGTEKIEVEVHKRFPKARTARLDLDTTRSRGSYSKIIDDFAQGKTDILIGTQMVSKGLDFGNVRTVGILDADTMLNRPDFRCHERAYQMMAQVAGRAGRRNRRGHVILQTRRADNPLISQVVNGDYISMFQEQMLQRQQFYYPPFYRLIYVWLKHRNEVVVNKSALMMTRLMQQAFGGGVLGPDRPAVARINMLHIRKIALKVAASPRVSPTEVRKKLRTIAEQVTSVPGLHSTMIFFDVDPL